MAFGLRHIAARAEIARRVRSSRILHLDELLRASHAISRVGSAARRDRARDRAPAQGLPVRRALSNLDAALRVKTGRDRRLHRELGSASMIYVTHDQTER